jgi:hemerythrin
MEAWAASDRFRNILFLCINVDEPMSEAQAASNKFIHDLNLLQSTIGFVEERPAFGQLGCSGFIVADKFGDVILPRSPAYLQYGHHAFLWMERFLVSLESKASELTSNSPSQPNKKTANTEAETDSTKRNNVGTQDFLKLLNSSLKKTSIKSMDDDHAICFDLLAELVSKKEQKKSEALQLLDELHNHLQDHFEQEEFFMDKCKYGGGRKGMGFEGHRNDHNAILHRISAYITTLRNSKSTNSKELVEKKFIEDSFILDLAKALHHHIEAYDSLYSEDFVAAGFE